MILLAVFIGTSFLACDTQPPEAIDTSEAPLASESAPEVPEYDPAYLDDLTDHGMNLISEILPRFTEHEIDRILAGEMSSQEALEMGDDEYKKLWDEIEGLGAEASVVLSDDGWYDPLNTPYLYKPNKISCGQRFRLCLLKYLFMAGATGPLWGTGILAAGTASDCICNHCKGKWRDNLCGEDKQ